jgi:hypothetical protein
MNGTTTNTTNIKVRASFLNFSGAEFSNPSLQAKVEQELANGIKNGELYKPNVEYVLGGTKWICEAAVYKTDLKLGRFFASRTVDAEICLRLTELRRIK